MRKKITLSLLLMLFLIASKISAQCTTGTQYPAGIHQATGAAGTSTINTDARTGQYASVHVEPSRYYTFTSSVSTDYLTITNDTGTQVLASGVTPVSFVSAYNQAVRYYLHQNAQCQTTDQFARTRKVTWVTAQACLDVTPTGVSNITPISCTLNYTTPSVAPAFGYQAYVSTSSATPGASVQTSSSSTNSMLVTNLNPDTTYHYWLRSRCDYQYGAWIYGGTFTTISSLLCNSAYYGIYPSATVTPNCNGNDDFFATDVKNGSFSNIAVVPNTQYQFKTNYGTDFITITNALGTVVLASGTTPVNWNSGSTSGVVRFYSHDNAQCGYGTSTGSSRNKYVNCITTSVTCLPPSNFAVGNITSNSIRMSWAAPNNVPSSGYEMYIITTNTAPTINSTATHTSTTTTKDINGLTAGVTYYYWVRSNCGNEKSSWASGGSFTMNQSLSCNGAIYGLYPDATFTPSCTGSAETITSSAFASQYSNVNITANQQYIFSSSVGTDFITITNSAGTSVLASGQTPLSWSSGTNTGGIRYYLHSNSNCGSQNTNRTKYIQCAATTSCGLPSQLSVSNITSNSCRLNWTAPATAPTNYDIYVITSNTAPTSTTTPSGTTASAAVGALLNGISAATTYYYWIRSNCNGTKSAWVYGGSFNTLAALTCNGATYGLYPSATFTPTCTGSPQQIVADAYAGEYSNVNVVANTQYTFFSSNSSDYITVTNALGNTVLASGTTPLNWVSGTYSGVVRYHINTNASCGTQNTTRVRYIQCMGLASCGAPSNLTVSNITSNSCRLAWSPPATAPSDYEVYFSTVNSAPGSGTAANYSTAATAIASLNPLSPSTTYYYWVRSNCNGSKSDWVSGGSFTTIAALACNGASFGLYPLATFTPACTGNTEQIVNNAYAGEYSNVNIVANRQYTFTSSVATDYITITNADGTTVFASGLTPLVWSSNSTSGVIRYYLHANANCGAQGTSRTRSIKCENITACNPPSQFWSNDITLTSATISWTPSSSAPNGGYVYTYGTNPNQGTTTGNTSTTNANLSNLSPNTTYYWWVAANCASGLSTWTLGGSFTTLPVGCWKTVSTGMSHSLGIKSDGTLWAWGANDFGQLGDGTSTNRTLPVQIGTANDWQSVSAGTFHSMAIKNNGTLWGWGLNGNSRLGDGTTNGRIFPALVNSDTNWKSVSAGDTNTAAIKTDGTLWAWGYNGYAQLGDGSTNNRSTPYQIGTATNWRSVDLGSVHALAIKTDGTLWAWGTNSYGQVGDGTTGTRFNPLQIGTDTDWKDASAGGFHSVGLKTNGILFTWGNNLYGQLGDGTNTSKSAPNAVYDGVKSISAGSDHTVGTSSYGNMWYCGGNVYGQLGDGTTTNRNTISMTNANNYQMAITGFHHTLLLNNESNISGAGLNGTGQLGNGSTANSSSWVSVACPVSSLMVDEVKSSADNLKVFPNPVNDILNVSSDKKIVSVTVFSAAGQLIFTKVINDKKTSIDVSNLISGVYMLNIDSGDKNVKTVKVIKK